MKLTSAQTDRAAGVLLGLASGDALGVPYEFAQPPAPDEVPEMRGGGLGNFEPGEWSDDTSMAMCIAEVAARGKPFSTVHELDAIASRFLRWYDSRPPDIGVQTRNVLRDTGDRRVAGPPHISDEMLFHSAVYAAVNPRAAGNGALMRTAPVALAHLDDRAACATAAKRVASLTHADPLAGDSCVLWSEAIRVAVLEKRFDVTSGLDLIPETRREQWGAWLADALDDERNRGEPVPGARFIPNGFTVTALQAALAVITSTDVPALDPASRSFPCLHLQHALANALRIGDDTDTVAAIAGGLLGAYWGASAVPWQWRRSVHGWPGKDGRELVSLATLATRGGKDDPQGWPSVTDVPYTESASADAVPHPFDDGVLLGTHAGSGHEATAVVSMCRVGRKQKCFGNAEVVVESRLMDNDDPDWNPNLEFCLYDTADAIRGLREEGHTVLLHCVAAQQRTPSVAVTYGVLLGYDARHVRRAVIQALPGARGWGAVWDAAGLGS